MYHEFNYKVTTTNSHYLGDLKKKIKQYKQISGPQVFKI